MRLPLILAAGSIHHSAAPLEPGYMCTHLLNSPGPFWCANDNLSTALIACMTTPELISVAELVTVTYSTAYTGTIDPPSYLTHDHVYLYSGKLDTVVNPGMQIWLLELSA